MVNKKIDTAELRKSTEEYIEASAAVAESELSASIIKVALGSTEPINKLISSMLVVSGATITLSISNASEVLTVLGAGTLKWMLALFVVSAVFGFVAKVSGVLVDIALAVFEGMQASVDEAYENFSRDREEAMAKARELGVVDVRWINLSASKAMEPIRFIVMGDVSGVEDEIANESMADVEVAGKLRPIFVTLIVTVVSSLLQATFLLTAILIAITGIE